MTSECFNVSSLLLDVAGSLCFYHLPVFVYSMELCNQTSCSKSILASWRHMYPIHYCCSCWIVWIAGDRKSERTGINTLCCKYTHVFSQNFVIRYLPCSSWFSAKLLLQWQNVGNCSWYCSSYEREGQEHPGYFTRTTFW